MLPREKVCRDLLCEVRKGPPHELRKESGTPGGCSPRELVEGLLFEVPTMAVGHCEDWELCKCPHLLLSVYPLPLFPPVAAFSNTHQRMVSAYLNRFMLQLLPPQSSLTTGLRVTPSISELLTHTMTLLDAWLLTLTAFYHIFPV